MTKRLLITVAAALVAGCAYVPTPPPSADVVVEVPVRAPRAAELEIAALLEAIPEEETLSALRSNPFVFSLGYVAEATSASAWDEFLHCWDFPDTFYVDAAPSAQRTPEAVAVAAACSNVLDDLEAVLVFRGWTLAPAPPASVGGWIPWKGRARHLYTVKLPQLPVFGTGQKFLDTADLDTDEAGNVWMRTKGGVVQLVIPPDPGLDPASYLDDPAACPTATEAAGAPRVIDAEVVVLADPAKTFGGFAILNGRSWFASYENYNVAGRDNYTVTCVRLDGTGKLGPWRVGPANHGVPLVDAYHANKVSGGVDRVPRWLAALLGGRELSCWDQRPAGAFGGDFGPGCYVFFADPTTVEGGHLRGVPLLVYPKTLWQPDSPTAAPRYLNGENRRYAAVQWLDDGSSRATYFTAWMKGLGPNNYGPAQGCPGFTDKGWNSQPYEEWFYLYSAADLLAVYEGKLKPWQVQPVEEVRPDFLWQDPMRGFDPDCKRPYVAGAAWKLVDANTALLYLLQLRAYQVQTPSGQSNPLPVIHVVEFDLS